LRVRSFFAALALLTAFAFAITFAPRASADDVADEVDLQFQLGAERYRKGDFIGALEHFLESNRLAPNRNVVFNIARTYEQLKRYPEAYRYYVRALDGEKDAPTRARIEDAIARIAPKVAVVKVQSVPPNAKLYIDRKDLGERGNAPQRFGLAPGKYRVIAELPGYEDAVSAPIDAPLGREAAITLTLVRILGTVHVSGDGAGAAGAEVRVDTEAGPSACIAPCDLKMVPGTHTLFVSRPGFHGAQLVVSVAPKETVEAQPALVAVAVRTGTLVVEADEPNALIEVDDRAHGFAPAVVTAPVGAHHVRISKKGFRPIERQVTVAEDTQVKVEATLEPAGEVEAASRANEAVEDAPGSVSVLPSAELRAMAYPTLAEALRGTRGVFVSDDRSYTSIGIRGLGFPGSYGNRVLVLLDGQPMNDDWIGSSYVGYDLRTDLDDIDHLEVVRGPGSVLYGTNAFSGVVNMVPRGRDAVDGWEIGASTPEAGMMRGRMRVTKHFSEDSGAWVSFAGAKGSGHDFFFPEFVADGPASVAGNARGTDGMDVGTWTGQAWWKSLTAQWSLNSHQKHLPSGEFQTILGDPRTRQTDTRGTFEVRFEPKLSESFQSLSRVHANYYGYRGTFAHLPPSGIEQDQFDGAWVGAEQRFVYAPTSRLRFTGGGEVQDHFVAHQSVEDEQVGRVLDDKRPFLVGAAYLLADVSPSERAKISAGARFDTYSTFGSSLNPRAAFIWKPYAADNVKLMAGKAFRAPSIYELYYAAYGQIAAPNLSPEDIYSGEMEYSHRFSPTTTGILSVYANYVKNLIVLRDVDPTAGTVQYTNSGIPVVTAGTELEARREWKAGWMIAAAGSLQRSQYMKSDRASDLIGFQRSPDFREVPNVPPWLLSLKGAVPLLGRALTAMSRVTLEGPRFDRNDEASNPDPQHKTDASVIWDVVLSGVEQKWGVHYALGLYNIADWRQVAPVSTEFRQTTMPQPGRTLFASVSVTF
jgi:outer membrane receptor protein involved in Fe transport